MHTKDHQPHGTSQLAPKSSNLKMGDFLYLLHDDGDIDDEELLLLLEDHPRNLHAGLPYFKYEPFNIFEMREDECEVEFRFKKEDIFRLAAALPWLENLHVLAATFFL